MTTSAAPRAVSGYVHSETTFGTPVDDVAVMVTMTARGAADVVVTELSVFRLRDGALVLTELLGDATVDDVRKATGAPFDVDLKDRRAA